MNHQTLRRALRFLLVPAVLLVATDGADAQWMNSPFKVGGSSSLRTFRPAVAEARGYTVRIRRFDRSADRWRNAALGVVVTPDGLALTKASELEGRLRAEVGEVTRLAVKVLATDPARDLALVRIGESQQFSSLPTVRWADVLPRVGHWVVTPSTARTPTGVGVISVAARVVPRTDERAVLGVVLEDDTDRPVIDSVREDSAADRAGLQPNDVILKVDDVLLTSRSSLIGEISRHKPGDVVMIRIRRDRREKTVRATLRHLPPLTEDPNDVWNKTHLRSRWAEMNSLGSRLSERRSNFPRAVQHDTVLRPEDCGGVVVNLDGEAVGLNIARAGRTESYYLPAAEVRETLRRLRELAGV